jgi:hypothetical protein
MTPAMPVPAPPPLPPFVDVVLPRVDQYELDREDATETSPLSMADVIM